MGVVACIFRRIAGAETILQVYGVNDQSLGIHLLTIRQSQLNAAVGESIIGVSPDGRALVVMWADRNVTVKVGPDHENKILHLTLQGGLTGAIIDLMTTYGAAPGLPYLGMLGQPADGSTALQDCQVTSSDILNFRQSPAGAIIGWIPYNASMRARARTNAWFQVNFEGAEGWISADWVRTQGICA